jgi:hypothetical protein
MSRHWASTALVLSWLLVLSACSSGRPASHTSVGVGSVVRIGPYTQVFAGQLPANAAQVAVVGGFRQGQVLWDESEKAWHLAPRVRDYVTGRALTQLTSAMKAGKERNLVPAGTDRFFMTRVTAISGRNATLTTCDDGSKFMEENPRTGKADLAFEPTPGQSYMYETWRMVRLSGHWAITGLSLAPLPSRSAEPCQPGMTGYGPSRPDVTVLLRKVGAAVRAARSMHVSGALQQGGKVMGVNFGLTRSGGFSGRISENGAAFTMQISHGRTYLKISSAFLRMAHLPATVCSRFCGKYLEYSAAQAHALVANLNMISITRAMLSTPARRVKLLGAVTVAGQLAWLLQDSQENSLYVAVRGKPYILRAVGPPPGEDSVNLTQWNAVRLPDPPPASQVVQPGQLLG